VSDVKVNMTAFELRDLGNRLLLLADQQEGQRDGLKANRDTSDYLVVQTREGTLRSLARAEYAARRSRARFFPEGIFGEAAWDILLDLYIAKLGGSRVSLKAACIASAVPETTAYRWIDVLVDLDLAQKSPDPADKRRCWLELSATGHSALRSYFFRMMELSKKVE
jgi:hypothetical protein